MVCTGLSYVFDVHVLGSFFAIATILSYKCKQCISCLIFGDSCGLLENLLWCLLLCWRFICWWRGKIFCAKANRLISSKLSEHFSWRGTWGRGCGILIVIYILIRNI